MKLNLFTLSPVQPHAALLRSQVQPGGPKVYGAHTNRHRWDEGDRDI